MNEQDQQTFLILEQLPDDPPLALLALAKAAHAVMDEMSEEERGKYLPFRAVFEGFSVQLDDKGVDPSLKARATRLVNSIFGGRSGLSLTVQTVEHVPTGDIGLVAVRTPKAGNRPDAQKPVKKRR